MFTGMDTQIGMALLALVGATQTGLILARLLARVWCARAGGRTAVTQDVDGVTAAGAAGPTSGEPGRVSTDPQYHDHPQ